jgi:hypothetical protein
MHPLDEGELGARHFEACPVCASRTFGMIILYGELWSACVTCGSLFLACQSYALSIVDGGWLVEQTFAFVNWPGACVNADLPPVFAPIRNGREYLSVN